MKKRILSLLLSVIMIVALFPATMMVHAETYGNFSYYVSSNEVTIRRYENIDATGSISIPSSIGGLPVTMIDGYAFQNCALDDTVTLPVQH